MDLPESGSTGQASLAQLEGLAALLNELPAALALLRGPDFVFETANESYLELVGRRDVLGKKLLEVAPEAEEQGFVVLLRQVLTTGETVQAREVEVLVHRSLRPGAAPRRFFLDFTYRRIADDQGAPYGVLVFAVDVTEKVSARAILQLEQVKLEAVFANASAALAFVRGPQAIYEKANASYHKLFIDRPLLGKPLLEALPELRGQKFPDLIASVFSTGVPYVESEARALLRRSADGALEERYFDQSYTRIADPDGQPYGVLIEAVDVTERVANRDRFRAEADKNARLLRLMPTAFFSVTNQWIITYLNPAAEELLGLRGAEVEGTLLWETFPGLRATRFGEAYARAMKEGLRVVTEDYYADDDRWYEAWAYPFDKGLAVSFFDITRRKQDALRFKAEKEKLEAVFQGSASPLVLFRGPELAHELVNRPYEDLVGGRALIGRPLLEALPEVHGSRFVETIQRVFETGEPAVTYEEAAPLLNAATGEIEQRFFDCGVSRINDGEGKPYGVFVQATEVTERVLARQKIEQALSTRDTFLSIASHELRTPLTGMKLQAQMMKRALAKGDAAALDRERVMKLVEQTDRGLSRIGRLVDDMLDISRIQNGKLALNPEPADLFAFVAEVRQRFVEEMKAAGIDATLSGTGPLPVLIDRFRMEQVLTNLITNAIKYAPRAPVSIELGAEEGICRMIFQDGGRGIAAQDLEKVFERFARLVSANEVSGMGLGLFIVRQIVQAHGGRIYAESKPGAGARFILELPVHQSR